MSSLVIKLFNRLLLFLSLFLILYVVYKSEYQFNGLRRDYYKNYFIFTIVLFLISIVFRYFSKKYKLIFILTTLPLIFTLYLFEAYLLLNDQSKYKDENKKFEIKKKIYQNIHNKQYDSRKPSEILKDLRQKNKKTSIRVLPKFYLEKMENKLLPLSGKSNSITILCNENGFYASYLSDRFGFNNQDENWNSSYIEYAILGASYPHGACVNRPDDISSIIAQKSQKKVINLSMAGNGPLLVYASAKEYLKDININKIIWFFSEYNDLIRLEQELKNPVLKNYFYKNDFTQNLILKQNIIDEMAESLIVEETEREKERYKVLEKYYIFYRFIKLYHLRMSLKSNDNMEFNYENFSDIVRLLNNFSKQKKANLYFVYIPSHDRYFAGKSFKSYKIIKKIIEKENIKFIDLHSEVLLKEKNPLDLYPFQMPGHFNIIGYKKVADKVFNLTYE